MRVVFHASFLYNFFLRFARGPTELYVNFITKRTSFYSVGKQWLRSTSKQARAMYFNGNTPEMAPLEEWLILLRVIFSEYRESEDTHEKSIFLLFHQNIPLGELIQGRIV